MEEVVDEEDNVEDVEEGEGKGEGEGRRRWRKSRIQLGTFFPHTQPGWECEKIITIILFLPSYRFVE